jgi:flavin reductase (DIM6/NTAB) family NADH-FMN oxidoreductase RutF
MAKKTIRYTDYFAETMRRMREDGLLLVTAGADGKPNVMTIGWGTIGSIWAVPSYLHPAGGSSRIHR